MDLLPTPEQEEIITTVRSLLMSDFDLNSLAERDGRPSIVDRGQWSKCADLGWFGLGLGESPGGVGYTLVEEALLFTEIGSHATPGPFLATILAGRFAALAGAHDVAASILGGESIVALAEPHGPGDVSVSTDLRYAYDTTGRLVAVGGPPTSTVSDAFGGADGTAPDTNKWATSTTGYGSISASAGTMSMQTPFDGGDRQTSFEAWAEPR